nr:MAG TPA: hypothetical protein [Caudoviricetes sp.]
MVGDHLVKMVKQIVSKKSSLLPPTKYGLLVSR